MNYPNIVLYGAPGVGKTTGLGFIEDLGWQRVSFAGFHPGGVRDIVQRLFGPGEVQNRPILNWIGMGAREFDQDVWIRNAMREVERLNDAGHAVVMDDMRGENEWAELTSRGFIRIHITADPVVREARLTANGKLEGADMEFLWRLESPEFEPDYLVDNSSNDRDQLYFRLADILNHERRRRS